MFGFVKAQGLPSWPATLVSGSGGRVKVTFFGTGKSAVVPKSEWIPYTPAILKKLDTSNNKRRWGAFRAGLKELRAALEGKKDSEEKKSRKDDKSKPKPVGLRKQQLENERMFKETIRRMEGRRQWLCLRCNLRTGLKYKAKTHAVLCNSMVRARKKRSKNLKCLFCSDLPPLPSMKMLRQHDMKVHSSNISFICVKHSKPLKFKHRQNFIRHMKEQHGGMIKRFKCENCERKFKRNSYLTKHIKVVHTKRQMVMELLAELVKMVEAKSDHEEVVEEVTVEVEKHSDKSFEKEVEDE